MTKEEALTLTAELYEWLAENPTKFKSDWPKWDKFTDRSDRYLFKGKVVNDGCFLCYLTVVKENKDCTNCLLKGNWGLESPEEFCCLEKGLFQLWLGALKTSPERVTYAKEIADRCRKKLQELKV